MRKFLLALLMILYSIMSIGQNKVADLELYTDPVRNIKYYSKLKKEDSLWHWQLVYIRAGSEYHNGWYKDVAHTIPHGRNYWFHDNKNLKEQADFVNGLREGVTFKYNDEGFLTDSIVYQNGKRKGIGYSWHSNGMIADSANFDGMGNGTIISWDENGMLHSAGYYINDTSKQGRWKYFHPNGTMHAIEDYKNGELTSITCFNDKGEPLNDCSSVKAEFKGGAIGWAKHVQRNLNANVPIDKDAPEGLYTVVIQFYIDIDGSIIDIKPLTKHGFGMEEEVVRILKIAGNWEPEQRFGVKVKTMRKQPVSFIISEQ